MKTIVHKLLIAILVPFSIASANPPAGWVPVANSTLEIKSQGSYYFSVQLDGRCYPNPVKRFSMATMTAGLHHVDLFAAGQQGHAGAQKLIYSGDIYIDANSLVTGVLDNAGRFYIKSVKSIPVYVPEPQTYYPPNTYPTCGTPPLPPKPLPMAGYSFTQLMDVIEDQWFESGRLQIAKQALNSNWFTANQVAEMMHAMSFEDTRLELAKAAYYKTVDTENYFIVNKEFWFSSSVDELSRYLSGI